MTSWRDQILAEFTPTVARLTLDHLHPIRSMALRAVLTGRPVREGLDLLQRKPRQDHIAVHWGMIMAVYPFWSAVARQMGRLLRLQGAAVHVQRRVREQYGEIDTVSRAARRVLRTYLDWGVLQDTNERGVYSAGSTVAVEGDHLIVWLVEAYLQFQNGGSAPLKDVLDNPPIPFSNQTDQRRNHGIVVAESGYASAWIG